MLQAYKAATGGRHANGVEVVKQPWLRCLRGRLKGSVLDTSHRLTKSGKTTAADHANKHDLCEIATDGQAGDGAVTATVDATREKINKTQQASLGLF
jgi:hypothetical protein